MRNVVAIGVVALLGGMSFATCQAQDLPARKPGLWQVTMLTASSKMPPQQMKYCLDAATDAALYKMGMSAVQGMCSRNDIHRSGNVVTIDTECKMGEMLVTSHSTMTFVGDTANHTDIQTHFDPPMMGRSDSSMTRDATWAGPCPADMQPGDIVMANGMKMNLNSMPAK